MKVNIGHPRISDHHSLSGDVIGYKFELELLF
jgi:hypothetical protein